MRSHHMAERREWSLLRRLPVSDPVRLALYDAAAERQKAEPDQPLTHLAGKIVNEALHKQLDVKD